MHRKQTGSFDGDVDEFCSTILRNVAWESHSTILDTGDGRSIQIVNRPLAAGGWVCHAGGHHGAPAAPRRGLRTWRITDALTDLPNRTLVSGERPEEAMRGFSAASK